MKLKHVFLSLEHQRKLNKADNTSVEANGKFGYHFFGEGVWSSVNRDKKSCESKMLQTENLALVKVWI